jgi:flagellar M-ring protein FliF
MAYIVSNSVEGLSPDNVAIMDATGRVLSAPVTAGAGGGLTGRQLEAQRSIETRTVDKIEDLVATVVGLGRVRAQVTAKLGFDQVDQTVETFNPDGQVLQTEQRSEGTAEGGGQQTVVSNQYQNSRRLERSQAGAGRLERLTVAVLVDEKALRAERTRQLADLDAMVRNAVGIDSTRGDRLSVLAVPFEPVTAEPAQATAKAPVDVMATAERFSRPGIGLVAIVAMILIALQLLRTLQAPRGGRATPGAPSAAAARAAAELAAEAEAEAAALPGPDEAKVIKLKERLRQESHHRPETTAQVMRAWLADKP